MDCARTAPSGEIGFDTKQNEIHAAMALAALDDVDAQVERNRLRYYAYKRLVPTVPNMRLLTFDESERCGFKNIVVELLDGWPVKREHVLAILHAERMLSAPLLFSGAAPEAHPIRDHRGGRCQRDRTPRRALPDGAVRAFCQRDGYRVDHRAAALHPRARRLHQRAFCQMTPFLSYPASRCSAASQRCRGVCR